MKTLGELATLVNGQLCGDPQLEILGAGTLRSCLSTEITFLTSARLTDQLKDSSAGACVIPVGFAPPKEIPTIEVEDVESAFVRMVRAIYPQVERPRIGSSAKAFISASAHLGENVSVYPGAFIGDNVIIGDNCTIYPNVCILENCRLGDDVQIFPNSTLYENTVIGDNTVIHAGTVLGSNGFGYESDTSGHRPKEQLGYVEVGSDVEIGANSCIDRGTYGATRIGNGSKFDNMVQVAHNCQIGEHNILCSQVGIAGSSNTGRFVVMGGQTGIGDHVDIGNGVQLGAKTGVKQSIGPGQTMLGIPAMPVRRTMQVWALTAKLPELRSEVKRLVRTIDAMQTEIHKTVEIVSASRPSEIRNAA